MFGHTVHINFNKQGDTHNTSPGGFFSLLIKFAIAVYVFINLKKLIHSEGDVLSSSIFIVDNELGLSAVAYIETKLILSPVIQKVRDGEIKLHYDDETKRYIELRFVQRVLNIEQGINEEYSLRAKECTEEEYSLSQSQRKVFTIN